MGFSAYIDDQFAKPATTLPVMAYQQQNQPGNCTPPLTAGGPAGLAGDFGTNCPRDLYTQFVSQRYFFKNAVTARRPAPPARRLGAVADPRDLGGATIRSVTRTAITSSCCRTTRSTTSGTSSSGSASTR